MIEVRSKDGMTVRCELTEFDYNGTFMGECFISSTVKSPIPIEFTIGDYLEYRSEVFVLNYTPAKQKKANLGSDGEAFIYDSLKFNSLADELTRCRFYDYVPYDNKVHFSNLSIFSFYASSVSSLAERIQVNLDRMYSGESKWTVSVHAGCVSKDKNISVSNISCFEALSLCKKEFDVNFITRGRTISIGAPGVLVGETFGYGKGKGLYAIEQTTNEDSLIVTRLRAYGSTRNMPYMHYKNPAINNLRLPGFIDTGINTFIDSVNISKYGVREGDVYFDGSDPNTPEVYPSMEGMEADDLISAGIPVDLDSGDNGRLDELVLSEQMTDNGVLPKDTGKESDKLKPNFKITLKDLGFDINKHKSIKKAAISIKSGMCIGREFEITKCVKVGNKYELTCNRFTDEDINIVFPNTDYQISGGDKFVLLNIEMPDVYIRAAEYRLLTLAKLYLSNTDESKYIYTPKIDEIYMANHPDIHNKLKEGDVFDFSDVDLDIRANVIIQSLSIHEGKSMVPTYEITLNNDFILSTIEKIQNSLNGTGNTTVKIIRSDIEIIESFKLGLILPTDKNVYSALSTDLRITEEMNDFLVDIDGMYLRKDIDDVAYGVIAFDKKIGSTVFIDGWEGKGWEMSETGAALFDSARVRSDLFLGNKFGSPSYASGFTGWGVEIDIPAATAEMDNMFIRKTFTAYEIVYSQIYGLGGSQIVSDLNKIAHVEVLSDRYRCYMDDMDGLMLMNLRKGDGVRIQTRTGTTSIKYLMGRCIGVDSEYFDIAIPLLEGTGQPEAGDFATRWGNNEDVNRQGLIYLTTADRGAPFIDVYDGITGASTEGKLKARLGKLSGIRTLQGDQLSGYGAYLNGVYIENSTFYTDTGETVDQRFVAMNGKFDSAIAGIKNDMSLEIGNILRNSSFGSNTNYWTSAVTVNLINMAGSYLWVDGSFYVDKLTVADIYNDHGRNVLRVRNTTISQINSVMNIPSRPETSEDGYAYSFAFYAKVVRPGTLTAGVVETDLYIEQQLAASEGYQKISKFGKWNEKGDFKIQFTGEILIYGVSLFNDALADAQIKLQTQILQTKDMILLKADKDYVDRETGQIYVHFDSQLQITAEEMSGISTKIDNVNNKINTAGWITWAEGVSLFAQEFDKTGVASSISQLNVKYNSISSSVSENEQDINNVRNLANSAASQAETALTCGVYGQEQYSQASNPWDSWESGAEYKHVGALWYNPDTGVTHRYTGTSGGNSWEVVSKSAITAASYVLQNKDKWSMVVANFDADGNPTDASGIITTTYGNSLWARKDGIISSINQTSEMISIQASKINLNGAVTANNTFMIDTAGFITATGGKIASFNIDANAMTIAKNKIYAGFGTETAPATLGLNVPLWIRNTNPADTVVAAHFSAENATSQFNNIAISMHGCISGFAVKVRHVDDSTILDNGDTWVSCYNKSRITVYLPSNPTIGKIIYIKLMNDIDADINGNGKQIIFDRSAVSNNIGYWGKIGMYVYDGQYWCAGKIQW